MYLVSAPAIQPYVNVNVNLITPTQDLIYLKNIVLRKKRCVYKQNFNIHFGDMVTKNHIKQRNMENISGRRSNIGNGNELAIH